MYPRALPALPRVCFPCSLVFQTHSHHPSSRDSLGRSKVCLHNCCSCTGPHGQAQGLLHTQSSAGEASAAQWSRPSLWKTWQGGCNPAKCLSSSAPLCLSIGILIKTCSKHPHLPRLLGNSPRLQPQPCL